ncbi:hypothetical protein ABT009_40700 [Streptomyces sp. NPDC002896]|uniref:hypothetical protein n=1 Tax=Streptomyces sp. NPDC002896 TaxID=3154438 RepID=UPI003320E6DF
MHLHAGPFAYSSDPTPVSTETDDTWRYVPEAEDPRDDGNLGPVPSMPPEGNDWAP